MSDIGSKINVVSYRDNRYSDLSSLGFTKDFYSHNYAYNNDTIRRDLLAAEATINAIVSGGITTSRLSLHQKAILFEYLEKYNPYVGRVIELNTILPLSSMTIQKNSDVTNVLVRDYIQNFFDNMNTNSEFLRAMSKAIRYYHLFGLAHILVFDDYNQLKDTNIDETDISSIARNTMSVNKVSDKEVESIVEKYTTTPDEVSWSDRQKVLHYFGYDINTKYLGVKKYRVLHPTDIVKLKNNPDTDYCEYEIKRTDNIDSAFEKFKADNPIKAEIGEDLNNRRNEVVSRFVDLTTKLGYTKGYVIELLKSRGQRVFKVDSDPYSKKGMYVIQFKRSYNDDIDGSLVNRILDSAIDYLVSCRRERERANMAYKQQRLFTVRDGSQQDAVELKQAIDDASVAAEAYDVVTNLDIGYQDLTLDVKHTMDFSELKNTAQQNISVGLGMTDSLLAGGESYSTAFLKVELLTTEYQNFRNDFTKFVHKKIFEPVAVKRGFVNKDNWGNDKIIIPSVRFDRMSIARGSEDFQLILQMVNQKQLPVSALLKQLGFDPNEVESQLLRESTSILNPSISQVSDGAAQALADLVSKVPDFYEKIAGALGLDKKTIRELHEKRVMVENMQMGLDADGNPMQ